MAAPVLAPTPGLISKMKRMRSLHILAKFFQVSMEIFEEINNENLNSWADEVCQPGYQLKHWQINFLLNLPYTITE